MDGRRTRPAPDCLRGRALARIFVEATARALSGHDCRDLDNGPGRRQNAADGVDGVDAEAVAEWSVGQYEDSAYPAVVLGSPHGAAVHLAVAIGAPWLPTSFPVTLAGAHRMFVTADDVVEQGQLAGREILSRNSGVDVRQVHDPMRHGARYAGDLVFHLRWRRLPGPYLRFLRQRLRPGGAIILITDDGTWPVITPEGPVTTQFGSMSDGLTWPQYRDSVTIWLPDLLAYVDHHAWQPADAENATQPGLERDLRGHGEQAGHPVVTIGYDEASSLSAAVADCTRQWLRAHDKTGNRLAVECGRLLDPFHVRRAGLVPYWCESATTFAVDEAELWLAGSEPFTAIEMLPEPPGHDWSGVAAFNQWVLLARFSTRRGSLGNRFTRAYPDELLATTDASAILGAEPYDLPMAPIADVGAWLDLMDGLAMNSMKLVGMESGDTAAEGTPPESRSPTALGRFDRYGPGLGPRG